tara:strand:- start:350 stop:670 length:321 start_codon:yes stop_codon:yes gene_type:complete
MNIQFTPNATQVETIRTLLNGAERVSDIAKKSGLVSKDSDHTTFMTHELERLRALGFVERVGKTRKSKNFFFWQITDFDFVMTHFAKDLGDVRKRDQFLNWIKARI